MQHSVLRQVFATRLNLVAAGFFYVTKRDEVGSAEPFCTQNGQNSRESWLF